MSSTISTTTSLHSACPYESPYYLLDSPPRESRAKALIVSHHLLAGVYIDKAYSEIVHDYDSVIIIGPNHKEIGIESVQLSNAQWTTKFGILEPNSPLLSSLTLIDSVAINEDYFDIEHSICTQVTFIKKYFPDTRIIPIIIKNSVSEETIVSLAEKLKSQCDNCLVITSVDFSHYVSESVALVQDGTSIEALQSHNVSEIDNITSDCNQCLKLTKHILDPSDTFVLTKRSSSYDITQEYYDDITSYIFGYFSSEHQ